MDYKFVIIFAIHLAIMFNCKILHKNNKAQPLDQNDITLSTFLSKLQMSGKELYLNMSRFSWY